MDDLNIHVLNGFGVKAKYVRQQKASYVCATDKGEKIIKKSFDSAENILLQRALTEHMRANGYARAVKFELSEAGLPYVHFGGELYTMTDYLPRLTETDFHDRDTFVKILRNIGLMHQAASGFFGAPEPPDAIERFKKGRTEMTAIKKRLRAQKRLSDIDVTFLKNYEFYAEKIDAAIRMMEDACFSEAVKASASNGRVCHGAIKEETALTDGDDIYFYNFSRAFAGHAVFDVCDASRRHARRPQPATMPFTEALRLYRDVTGEVLDFNIAYPLMLYPEKFIRVCGQYYRKKRTWIPSAMANRMEKEVNSKDAYYEYIESAVT
ncbi:MAG: hypothetical protein LBL35_00435 [Clostridiales bacterium]|jgi:CotS family spore coat protein|nr:hypothetical protein [Clostridiales bacterium]